MGHVCAENKEKERIGDVVRPWGGGGGVGGAADVRDGQPFGCWGSVRELGCGKGYVSERNNH